MPLGARFSFNKGHVEAKIQRDASQFIGIEENIDDLVKDSRANRKVFVDAVDVMSRRLDKVEDDVSDILGEVKHIEEKL